MNRVFILCLKGALFSAIFLGSCSPAESGQPFADAPFFWEKANIYFLLTYLTIITSNSSRVLSPTLKNYYSNKFASVNDGEIMLDSDFQMALLGIKNR